MVADSVAFLKAAGAGGRARRGALLRRVPREPRLRARRARRRGRRGRRLARPLRHERRLAARRRSARRSRTSSARSGAASASTAQRRRARGREHARRRRRRARARCRGRSTGTASGSGTRTSARVVPNLVLKLGFTCVGARAPRRPDEALARTSTRSRTSRRTRGCPSSGSAAFAHKGGIHVQAVALDPTTYEHVDPAVVGNARHILVSELSGRNNVIERARELGLELDPDSAVARGGRAQDQGARERGLPVRGRRSIVRAARAPRGRRLRAPVRAAGVRGGRAQERRTRTATRSTASAEVALGGEVLRGEATGGGPVDALEKAMRRALLPAYPQLAGVWLSDFRSQIAHGRDGERGAVRVRITRHGRGREAVDDGRQRAGSPARELARARRLPRVRGR